MKYAEQVNSMGYGMDCCHSHIEGTGYSSGIAFKPDTSRPLQKSLYLSFGGSGATEESQNYQKKRDSCSAHNDKRALHRDLASSNPEGGKGQALPPFTS
jgi:hypothetical protein